MLGLKREIDQVAKDKGLDSKEIIAALEEAMAFPGPALVNVMISQESVRKPQQFRWHS